MSVVNVTKEVDRDWFVVQNGSSLLPAPVLLHKEFTVTFVMGGRGSFRIEAGALIYGHDSSVITLTQLGQWVTLRVNLEKNVWVAIAKGTGGGSAGYLPDPNLVHVFSEAYGGPINIPGQQPSGLENRLNLFAQIVGETCEYLREPPQFRVGQPAAGGLCDLSQAWNWECGRVTDIGILPTGIVGPFNRIFVFTFTAPAGTGGLEPPTFAGINIAWAQTPVVVSDGRTMRVELKSLNGANFLGTYTIYAGV